MNQEIVNQIKSFCGIDTFPELPCPYCSDGVLRLKKNDVRFRELQKQYDEKDFEDIDFESHLLLSAFLVLGKVVKSMNEVQAKFSAFLRCKSCHETAIVVGKAIIPSKLAKERGFPVRTRILPEYFTPPLPMIRLGDRYPKSLRNEITRSFSTFFSDPASCGNAIRHSVEALLDDQKVESTKESGSDGSVLLKLVDRIRLFEKKFPDAKLLHGIRFIGNQASHHSTIKQEDLLDAYKILEHVMKELYIRPIERREVANKSRSLEDKYRHR